jgi:plasmid stabilization system protein ParE
MKNVVVADDAVQDIEEARDFYNLLEKGAGEYFVTSILDDLEDLSKNHGIHSKHFGFYRKLSKKFPYAIYYNNKKTLIEVVGILDLRKNPIRIYTQLIERKK